MKLRWRTALCLLLCGAFIVLLADAVSVRQSVSEALTLCAHTVIPALFPFLVLSSLLVGLGLGNLAAPLTAPLMESLYGLPGEAGTALLLGLAGGYPIGAATAVELCRKGTLSQQEAQRLLTFCNNSGLAFFISVLGAGVFGSVRTGLWLWLIHLLSALLTGLLFCGRKTPSGKVLPHHSAVPPVESPAELFVRTVRDSAASMLSVCAFVVIFYVAAAPLAALGGHAGPLLVGSLELFSLVPLLRADRFCFVLSAAAGSWGGLSVLCQTAAVLAGSDLHVSLAAKAVQALFSAVLALLLSGYVLA